MKIKIKKISCVSVLFLYWLALVVWQNIGDYTSKSFTDVVFKFCLLLFLLYYFCSHMRLKKNNIMMVTLFICSTLPAFFLEMEYSLSTTVYYCFIWLFTFCIYGIGNSFTITKNEYFTFLDSIIIVALYAAIYSLFFYTEQFTSAFYITNAYGNELSSFFSSSHEYGMYISAAIIACFFNLEEKKEKKIKYILALIILVPNLVLTFSRTAIFSTAIFFVLYVILSDSLILKRRLLYFSVIAIAVFCISTEIQDFIFNIVNKGGNVNSRNILMDNAFLYFSNASTFTQLFGGGISEIRTLFKFQAGYASVHNAYVQVLLYFGIIGLLWMLSFLFVILKDRVNLYKNDKFWGNKFICLTVWCLAMMVANTYLIFTSSIDCYFLTIYAIVIPKYVINWVKNEKVDNL